MEDMAIKEISKKYNKSENIVSIMIYEAKKSGYNLKQATALINEFYILNNTCKRGKYNS